MSQTTKYLNKINECIDTAQAIHWFNSQHGPADPRVKSLRENLFSSIPSKLVRILAQASDKDLCALTGMADPDGPAEEVRAAARMMLDRWEAVERVMADNLMQARRRRSLGY